MINQNNNRISQTMLGDNIDKVDESIDQLENSKDEIENKTQFSSIVGLSHNHYVNHKWKYVSCLLIIGLMNNLGYCLVCASAQNLSSKFHMASFMAVFQLALIVFSFIARLINSIWLIRISHQKRIFTIQFLSLISFTALAVANLIESIAGFYIAIGASCIIGMCCAIGESTILGFLQSFPSGLVSGWGGGTGLAGVSSNLLYLLTSSQGVNDACLFIPLMFISTFSYWQSFQWVNRQKNRFLIQPCMSITNNEVLDNTDQDLVVDERDPLNSASNNVNLTMGNIKQLKGVIFWYAANMAVVYYFEYVIQVGFFDRSNPLDENKESSNFLQHNAYVVLSLCYQIGVLISRSSLSVIKIKRVEIMTVLQMINFFLYLFNSKYRFMHIYLQMAVALWVGLMGGASYVNVTHNILEDKEIAKHQKELAMNICTFANDFMIFFAAITALILTNTYLSS